MATALIPVSTGVINNETVPTVDARTLHAFLEAGKDFSSWLKERVDQYEFIENHDFICSPVLGSNGRGGHNRKEYTLTLDMAKELSMVERNEKGKQARQYFIECEKRLLKAAQPKPKALPHDLTLDQQDTIKQLVKARVEILPEDRRAKAAITCWSSLKSKFGCTYKEIPAEKFTDAVSLVARIPLEGELLDKFRGSDEEVTLTIKEYDCYLLFAFMRMVGSFKPDLQQIEAALRAVGSPMAGRIYSMHSESAMSLNRLKEGVIAKIEPIFERYQQRYRMNGC